MTTFYVGLRPVLASDNSNLWINTYTHQLGNYSNWSIMSAAAKPLTGAPDKNRIPGGGAYNPNVRVYGEGDVMLSQMYNGLFIQLRKNSLKYAGSPFSIDMDSDSVGRWITEIFRGVPSTQVFTSNYRGPWGHVTWAYTGDYNVQAQQQDPGYAYRAWSNYIYFGLSTNQALPTSSLGHAERYPMPEKSGDIGGSLGIHNQPLSQASTFGAFEPYIYKGLETEKSRPMGDIYRPGHAYIYNVIMPDQMPPDYGGIAPARVWVNHYGDDHTREWFGVPSAKALDVQGGSGKSPER